MLADQHRKFLAGLSPDLAEEYRKAEQTAFDVPRMAYLSLRRFAEVFLNHPAIASEVPRRDTLYERLQAVSEGKRLPITVIDALDTMRRDGNVAAHAEPADRKPERSIEAHLRAAWDCTAWLHVCAGGREDEVPVFRPPTAADSAVVFREAMLGGNLGAGDPTAKYHVALALIEHNKRMREAARTSAGGMFFDRRSQVKALLEAAWHDVPNARSVLADILLHEAPPSPEVITKAMELLEWGCTDNDSDSLFLLGAIHFHGMHGQPVNEATALSLFERAAAREHPGALHALAVHYTDGIAVERDPVRAREFARQAAMAGDVLGQDRYGVMLIQGTGGGCAPTEGETWIRRALAQGYGTAAWHLYGYVRDGRVAPRANEDERSLLDLACENGSVEALLHRGWTALDDARSIEALNGPLSDSFAAKELATTKTHKDEADHIFHEVTRRTFEYANMVAQRYAELSSPCPCGSGKIARFCHRQGE